MKGIVAEIKGKYAVILTQDGLFKKVRALPGMTVGMETELERLSGDTGNRRFAARVVSMAAAGLLVLGVGFGAYSYTIPYSYVDIDINPSIELAVNIYDRIIDTKALNEDGEKLLMSKDLRHKSLDNGVRDLLNRAVEQGYLTTENEIIDDTGAQDGYDQPAENSGQVSGDGSQTSDSGVHEAGNDHLLPGWEKGTAEQIAGHTDAAGIPKDTAGAGKEPAIKNAVMVTVSSNNSKKSGELKKKIASTASKELGKEKVSSEILVGETSNEQREAARELGVTPGKLSLIEDVLKHLPEKELDDVKNTAVKDLLEIVRINSKDVKPGKGAPGKKDDGIETGSKANDSSKINNGGKGSKSSESSNKIESKNDNSKGNNKGNSSNSKKEYPENSRNNAGKNEKTAPGVKSGRDDSGGNGEIKSQKGKTESSRDKNDAGNKDSSKDNKKNSGNDRKDNHNDKKNEINVREVPKKSAEELRKERESLKDELLRQIGNSREQSGKDRPGQDAGKDKKEDKGGTNRKDDDKKNQNSGKKAGPHK